MSVFKKSVTSLLVAAAVPLLAGSAFAVPLTASIGLKNSDVGVNAELVQMRGRSGGGAMSGAGRSFGGRLFTGGGRVASGNSGWSGGRNWSGNRWAGGGFGRGAGFGIGIGIGTGLLLGGALAARPYYDDYAYDGGNYGYNDYGYDRGYVAVAPGGDDAGYCAQRFRSYDPRSGTYLGYDGYRHPCP